MRRDGHGGRAPGYVAWAGVDVGAAKGFDVAVIDASGLVAGPTRIVAVGEVVNWLVAQRASVVAVDSPRSPARDGELSRPDERLLVRAGVCGIRYTPDRATMDTNRSYYAWIRNGLRLYDALADRNGSAGWTTIECFPTATWSRLGGARGKRSRAAWSREVLERQGLGGLPRRMSQDARDAIGAALTARLYDARRTERFGQIVVPVASPTG
jgi:predicted nuclease with RNAse H fold